MPGRIFFDTNPVIYFLEEVEPFATRVNEYIFENRMDDAEFYTSTITDAEFLVKPVAENNFAVINKYNDFLKDLDFLKCFINDKIAFRSTQLRTKYKGLKLADSLQLASAIELNCDAFLTNDIQLKQVSEVNVVCLSDLSVNGK